MLFLCNDCNGVLPKTKSSADLEVLEGEEPPAEYESSAFVVEDLCGGFPFPFNVTCQSILRLCLLCGRMFVAFSLTSVEQTKVQDLNNREEMRGGFSQLCWYCCKVHLLRSVERQTLC